MKGYLRIVRTVLFLLLFIAWSAPGFCQYGSDTPNHRKWTRRTPAFRIGLGRQPAYFIETGVGVHRVTKNPGIKASDCFYGGVEFSGVLYDNHRGFLLTAIKAGYERSWKGILIGLEGKRYPATVKGDWIIAPRAGLTLRGILSLAYAYNFSFNDYPYPRHGPHQLSLTANLYRGAFRR